MTSCVQTGLGDWWIGKAGSMNKLPTPDEGYDGPRTRSKTVHDLISGGAAVTHRARARRQWTLPFSNLTEDEAALIEAVFDGTIGSGPYCFVDSSYRNVLSARASTLGAAGGEQLWAASAGVFADNVALAGPSGLFTGVATWTGAGNGSRLFGGGATSASIDATVCPVLMPGVPAAFSLYACTAAGAATVTPALWGGSTVPAAVATGAPVALNTNWTRISVLYAGATPALYPYVLPVLTCSTAAAPVIRLAAAQLEYGTAVTPWVKGNGSPRVIVAAELATSHFRYWAADRILTLREV